MTYFSAPKMTQYEVMQSLSSWMRSLSQDGKPPEKPECMAVAESLLMELEYQINEAVVLEREQEHEERRKATGVDYSWLITHHPKTYQLPELDKLEIEELCMKVKAKECGVVIKDFRQTLLQPRKPEEIPRLFRTIILQVLELRPKEDTMTEWMVKSLTKLRPSSARITPVNSETNEISAQDVNKYYASMAVSKSMPHLRRESTTTSSIEDLSQPVFKHVNRLEDLPV